MARVDYLVVADAAASADGKHYIHGAGWDAIFAASFPVTHPSLGIAIRLRVTWMETNQPHEIELDVLDADGSSVLPDPPGAIRGQVSVGRPVNAIVGSDQVIPLALTLANLQFQQPGTYEVVMRLNGLDAARMPLNVVPLQGAPG